MLTLIESRFWPRVRRAAGRADLIADRIEHALSSGWPDVLLRGPQNLHIWIELKIAKGPNARIKVRPEQTNWIEDHAARGGLVFMLAQDNSAPDFFWIIEADDVRRCIDEGCMDCGYYPIKQLHRLMQKWSGKNVKMEYADTPAPTSRPRLAFTPRTVSFKGAVV